MKKYLLGLICVLLLISLSSCYKNQPEFPVYSPGCVNLDSPDGDEVREMQKVIDDYLSTKYIRVVNHSLKKWDPENNCYYDIVFVIEIANTLPSNASISELNKELNELLGYKIEVEIIENSYLVPVH